MDNEENKIPRADIRWYHNVGFFALLGIGAVIIIGAGMFLGSLI